MATIEQPPVTPEVRFLPRGELYSEYHYSKPTTERSSLGVRRFQRNFERQVKQIVDYDPFKTENLSAIPPAPEITILKKENWTYIYEYKLPSSPYTIILSARPQSVKVLEGRKPVDAFCIEHLLVERSDGQVTDAFAQYPRHVPNYLTFSQIPTSFASRGGDYVLASFDVGVGNGDPNNLVYTLLHENGHIALHDVDGKRKGREKWLSRWWNPDPDGRAYLATRERDANAFALRVGKRLGIDIRSQMAFHNAALKTYDEWSIHGIGSNPALYANSEARQKARQNKRQQAG